MLAYFIPRGPFSLPALLAGLLTAGGYVAITIIPRTEVYLLIGLFAALFGGYFWLLQQQINWKSVIGWAVLFRLIAFVSFPNLSDDLYRFVWDGLLWSQGINPFLQLPGYYLQPGNEVPGLTEALYNQLNSPEYYTIYPPVSQLIFTAGTSLFPNNLYGSVLVMKAFLLAAEFGTLFLLPQLLKQLKLPEDRMLWYAFNPLVIVEFCGNLHFEAIMICLLLLAIHRLMNGQWMRAALWMSLAITTKLIPLLFLPFLIRRMPFGRLASFYALTGTLVILQFLPFLSLELILNMSESVDLYFQKFEFNASLYYLARWVGFEFSGYNLIRFIGPGLSAGVILFVIIRVLREKTPNWNNLWLSLLFAQSFYYFSATIVHPWYLTTLVALSIFTARRYAILWSGMAVLSYFTYRDTTYTENLWLVAIEYGTVFAFLVWEWRSGRTIGPLVDRNGARIESDV